MQVIWWLLPAHLHQPGTRLIHLPPQHVDWDGLHLWAKTPTAICGPAAPTPCWCLRAHLSASQAAWLADALEATWLVNTCFLLGSLTGWYDFSRQCQEEPRLVQLPDGRLLRGVEQIFLSGLVLRQLIIKLIDLDKHQAVRKLLNAASASRVCACPAYATKVSTWKVSIPFLNKRLLPSLTHLKPLLLGWLFQSHQPTLQLSASPDSR